MKHILKTSLLIGAIGLMQAGCGSSGASYSLLASGQGFTQATTNSQIDMLWVVDNSASMQPLQDNMTSNFNSFMTNFNAKGYDFQLAVTTSEAYTSGSQFHNDPTMAKFRDGVGTHHTGVFDILPSTMNLIATFVTNASLGMTGSGDERVFSSFKAALDSPLNQPFLRPKSFLAVIILSDEDDFSDSSRPEFSWTTNGGVPDHDYNDPNLDSVDSYVSYLDTLTATTGATRRYSVNAITVLDAACQQAHAQQAPSTIIGQRYIQLVNQTGGVLGSVCDASYANSLTAIQQKIIELGTQFYLQGSPVPDSIRVVVNGLLVPNDPTLGWTYNAAANAVMFHGAAVPPAGAQITVTFDPAKLTF